MAQKRMFSIRITNSRRFKRMSREARLLYYDLGMMADDDGFVEGYDVCVTTGATEKALHELADNRYLCELNDDGLCWLACWKENNQIKKDRYRESVYHYMLDDLRKLYPEDEMFSTAQKSKIITLDTEYNREAY